LNFSALTSGLIALVVLMFLIAARITWGDRRKKKNLQQSRANQSFLKIKAQLMAKTLNHTVAAAVFGQFMHETANGTSPLFMQNNNLFGMKHPQIRPTLSLGMKNGYADYTSTWSSIEDLFLWFKSVGFPIKKVENLEAYVLLLKSYGYFEDTYFNYLNGVYDGSVKFYDL